MVKQPLGIRFTLPADQDAIGAYESAGGIETFETDAPYLLTDGSSLIAPLPVFDAGGPVFQDSMGNAQSSMPISGTAPPTDGITWDNNTTWDNGTYWS